MEYQWHQVFVTSIIYAGNMGLAQESSPAHGSLIPSAGPGGSLIQTHASLQLRAYQSLPNTEKQKAFLIQLTNSI